MSKYNKFKKDAIFGKNKYTQYNIESKNDDLEQYSQIEFEEIYNYNTLNIFSDASGFNDRKASYGIIATCRDTIIYTATYCLENGTAQRGEALGLRLALLFAITNANKYKHINIFTDSRNYMEIICGFENYQIKPMIDDGKNSTSYILYNPNSGTFIVNSDILIECIRLFIDLHNIKAKDFNSVKLRHINSHIINEKQSLNINDLDKARKKYQITNFSIGIPSREYFMYIAKYNNIIDYIVKMTLKEMIYREKDEHKLFTYCPIHFLPPKAPLEPYRKEKF